MFVHLSACACVPVFNVICLSPVLPHVQSASYIGDEIDDLVAEAGLLPTAPTRVVEIKQVNLSSVL